MVGRVASIQLAEVPVTEDSPLEKQIKELIVANGPISLADYMGLALMHPVHGYYNRDHVFGARGDFVTAPEISQMFGEIIGLALLERWQHAGKPAPVRLVEYGPGRGTLMADMVKAFKADPSFAPTIHFIEASDARKGEQQDRFKDATWHSDVNDVPDGFTLIVANEFFDALPIRQFQFDGRRWRERMIGLNGDQLAIGLGAESPLPACTMLPAGQVLNRDVVIEVAEAGYMRARAMGDRLKQQGGAALIIDYGYDSPRYGVSFQAVKNHTTVDPLKASGTADLTSHVCFSALKDAMPGLNAFGPAGQGGYLMVLGIGQRAVQLSKGADPSRQFDLLNALKRLTAPDQMGELFKVMMMTTLSDTPPGFEPAAGDERP